MSLIDTSAGRPHVHGDSDRQGRQDRDCHGQLPRGGGHDEADGDAYLARRTAQSTRKARTSPPSTTCSDEADGSGLLYCSGDLSQGNFVSVSVGHHTFTVHAQDNAGNTTDVVHRLPGGRGHDAADDHVRVADRGDGLRPEGQKVARRVELRGRGRRLRYRHLRGRRGERGGDRHVDARALTASPPPPRTTPTTRRTVDSRLHRRRGFEGAAGDHADVTRRRRVVYEGRFRRRGVQLRRRSHREQVSPPVPARRHPAPPSTSRRATTCSPSHRPTTQATKALLRTTTTSPPTRPRRRSRSSHPVPGRSSGRIRS